MNLTQQFYSDANYFIDFLVGFLHAKWRCRPSSVLTAVICFFFPGFDLLNKNTSKFGIL